MHYIIGNNKLKGDKKNLCYIIFDDASDLKDFYTDEKAGAFLLNETEYPGVRDNYVAFLDDINNTAKKSVIKMKSGVRKEVLYAVFDPLSFASFMELSNVVSNNFANQMIAVNDALVKNAESYARSLQDALDLLVTFSADVEELNDASMDVIVANNILRLCNKANQEGSNIADRVNADIAFNGGTKSVSQADIEALGLNDLNSNGFLS